MPIKLVPKQYDALVERVRDALNQIRAQERAIMQLCVRDARMPRADFLRQFPSNETNLDWAEQLAAGKSKYAEAIGNRRKRFSAASRSSSNWNSSANSPSPTSGHQSPHVHW